MKETSERIRDERFALNINNISNLGNINLEVNLYLNGEIH